MADPIYSPDGKFMWSGTEWIPAPPTSEPEPPTPSEQALNMQDSVIGGDVVHSTVINNDPTAVTTAVIAALQQLGMVGQSPAAPQAPPTPEVELPASFSVGDHVEYHSPTNERWLNRCTVVGINDDRTYRIEVPKSSRVETKHAVVIGSAPGTIRPAAPPFNAGDRVLVNWKNYGHYYPGRITTEHDDHTFMIHFDDGDVEDSVEWGRIEAMQEDSAEVQEYMETVAGAEQELIEAFQVFDEAGTGTISAQKYFEILTEIGDEPISVDDVLEEFAALGIGMDSEIDYRELAKYMASTDSETDAPQHKPEVIIRDAQIEDGCLKGYAYAHPKLGEGSVRTSTVLGIEYDERATARVETRNTMYVVGPTGWTNPPTDHPFNALYGVGEQIKVEWEGSWWDANILEINGDNHLIHYVGFDSSWDEWVTTERMQKIS
ncbi:MAG TPA: Tudor-knot domain-containing protein [Candidatus Thalassarchaeaceae archaeon]|nr:Tudor-knot domain-containing protein [Candidatus Thalassarchaeaceae archaeon]